VAGIIIFFGQLLSLQKTLAHLGEDLITGLKKRICSLGPSCTRRIGQQRRRRATVDDLKRCGAKSRVEGGVVAVLCP